MAETKGKKTGVGKSKTDAVKAPLKDETPPIDPVVEETVDELLAGNVGAHDDLTPEDISRGYRVGRWKDLPNYIAIDDCGAFLDEGEMKKHVRLVGLARIQARARKKYGKA